ncbi:MAG TPA: hypothetical protein VMB52_01145, partial [Verrucomicrobiae bacterium]|nr:hypothetical protein [Verrucomicrobiae bacterium]
MSTVWLCNAFAVLIFTVSPLFVFAPASARPAEPSPGGGGGDVPGGGTINAVFLDANHIGIETSGNITFSYHDTEGNGYTVTTSLFPLQGVYYGQTSQYPSWDSNADVGPIPVAGMKYWFDNNQTNPGGSVCSGHNSDVVINSFDASTGDATGTLEMRIPVINNSGSTNTTPTCQPIGNGPDQNGYDVSLPIILNTNTGYTGMMKSFSVGTTTSTTCTKVCTQNDVGGTYSTLSLPYVASSANFYENDSSDIYASVYDPSINAQGGGNSWQPMYEFTSPTTNKDGTVTFHQGTAGYVNGSCPDTLTLPKGASGTFVRATYSVWQTSTTTCGSTDPTKPIATYSVMVLMQTPEAYLDSLTGQSTGTTGSGGAGGSNNTELPDCNAGGGGLFSYLNPTKVLNWILCAAINLALQASTYMDSWIMSQLNVKVESIFDTSSSNQNGQDYYTAWDAFRVIATGMLII